MEFSAAHAMLLAAAGRDKPPAEERPPGRPRIWRAIAAGVQRATEPSRTQSQNPTPGSRTPGMIASTLMANLPVIIERSSFTGPA